jgi:NAD(P)-dependent dehydrogenase (short-subunit alcohol dehydrogenase family)
MTISFDMTGRASLVTGAGSGLGRATALALARAGSDLCIVDINAPRLDETAELLRGLGVRAEARVADIAEASRCRPLVDEAAQALGRLDALCNVAGIFNFAHSPEMPIAEFERMIAVNLNAPFFLIQGAIPHLLQTHGAVVNVTSTAGFIGEAYLAAYCASKAGLNNLTRALAVEYIDQPIRFNAVAPGGMGTNIGENMRIPEGADLALIDRFTGRSRGTVKVDEVAQMVAYLASPQASGFHGACISIDNGITAG